MDSASATRSRTIPSSGEGKELLKIENTKLWVLGGRGHNRLVGVVKEGVFSVRMVVHALNSSCMMTKCVVEDTEWPLTKDSPVLRVGKRCFVFAMPGLVYGVEVAPENEEWLRRAEKMFVRFGCFEDYSFRENGLQYFGSEDDTYFWPLSQWAVEHITEPLLKKLGTYWTRDEQRVYNVNERVLRIQRMSFFVKLITKGLLMGKIDPMDHVVLRGRRFFAAKDDDVAIEIRASPTILLFADLVEILEESVEHKDDPTYRLHPPYEPRWTPVANVRFWNLSKNGIAVILHVLREAVHVKFEVTVNVILGQVIHNFFVPLRIDSNGNVEKETAVQRVIRFPTLDGVGTSMLANMSG